MVTINLPIELFNLISEYSNNEITFKKYKRKVTNNLKIQSITYKCCCCGKLKNFKGIEHFKNEIVVGVCKNHKNHNTRIIVMKRKYNITINRYTHNFGFHWYENKRILQKFNKKLCYYIEHHLHMVLAEHILFLKYIIKNNNKHFLNRTNIEETIENL